jgi:putative transposase
VCDDTDIEHLLRAIVTAAGNNDVAIHAFAIMTTHYHLIATPSAEGRLGKMMQSIGIRQTRYFNCKYERTGTIWNERYDAALLRNERYWYTCLRYVDLNPVRAQIVASPEDYRWSSYRFHAFGERCDWLTPHPLYLRLGPTAAIRQAAYRALARVPLTDVEVAEQRYPPRAAILPLPVGA